MPQLFNLSFLERLPFPTLKTYVGISCILLLSAVYQSHIVTTDEELKEQLLKEMSSSNLTEESLEWAQNSVPFQMLFFCLTDPSTVWIIVNMVCCFFICAGNFLTCLVFGKLRNHELQQLRDRLTNFAFHKLIFVFGVLNLQDVGGDELVRWAIWAIVIGFLKTLVGLSLDRFKYWSSSPSSSQVFLMRVMGLLGFCLFASFSLIPLVVYVFIHAGINYGLFVAVDVLHLMLTASHSLCRYGSYWYKLSSEATLTQYYLEFLFELMVLLLDLFHYVHLLFSSNMLLSMTSLALAMSLRQVYNDIDRKLKRHRNYKRIIDHIDTHFSPSNPEEVLRLEDPCAICWDRMQTGRKLPCGHFFHVWCLRGWLEQDPSCPTCRQALSLGRENEAPDPNAQEGAAERRIRHFNHLFHFDGGRYARWLPSFSVEVTHNFGAPPALLRNLSLPNSQYTTLIRQVQEMFPTVPDAVILEDLQITNSVELTIDNLLEGRIGDNGGNLEDETDVEDEFESDRDSGSSEGEGVEGEEELGSEHSSPAPSPSFFPSLSPEVTSGGRFSKSSTERESILENRKQHLINTHRRRYINSEQGAGLRHLLSEEPPN